CGTRRTSPRPRRPAAWSSARRRRSARARARAPTGLSRLLREQRGELLVQPFLRDRPARERGDLARAVDQEGLRVCGDAELADVVAVVVAQVRERDALLVHELQAALGGLLRIDAEHRP